MCGGTGPCRSGLGDGQGEAIRQGAWPWLLIRTRWEILETASSDVIHPSSDLFGLG